MWGESSRGITRQDLSPKREEEKGEELAGILLLIGRAQVLPTASTTLRTDIRDHFHADAHGSAQAADKLLRNNSLQLLLMACCHIRIWKPFGQ